MDRRLMDTRSPAEERGDCSPIQIDLVSYHLGAIDDEARARVEAHLVACASCVRAYVQLKRHAEQGASRPSDEARARLRAAVRAEFESGARARARRWLKRPIPLYQGLAAAAVIALAAFAVPELAKLSEKPAPAPIAGGARIDTARPSADSLSFY